MTEEIKNFCQLIQQFIFCEEKLCTWKLSGKKIQNAFHSLDFARRGSINVSDFFRNFSDFSQEDLFCVFKALDLTRSGTITIDDLYRTVRCLDSEDQSDRDSLSALKFCIKIMQMNYQEIEKKKSQLKIEQKLLQRVFEAIPKKNNKLLGSDIVDLMQNHLQQGLSKAKIELISEKIFHNQQMSMKEFIQYFKPFKWSQIPKMEQILTTELKPLNYKEVETKDMKPADINYLDIQKFYNYRPSPQNSRNYNHHQLQYTRQVDMDSQNRLKKVSSADNLAQNFYVRPQHFSQQNQNSYMRSQWHQQQKLINDIRQKYQNADEIDKKGYDRTQQFKIRQSRNQPLSVHNQQSSNKEWRKQITSSISNNMVYIQKRREQLRKCSQERQKIMDNIMAKRGNSNNGQNFSNVQNLHQERPKSGYTADHFYSPMSSFGINKDDVLSKPERIPRMSQQPKDTEISEKFNTPYDSGYDRLKQGLLHSSSSHTLSGKIYPRDTYLYDNQSYSRQQNHNSGSYLGRPASAQKPFVLQNNNIRQDFSSYLRSPQNYQRQNVSKYFRKEPQLNKNSRLMLNHTVNNGDSMKNFTIDKENILRRAEEQASRKIQEIQRKARIKVMEKRSGLGLYNQWLK